ncbi:hypothetical protein [Streptomyces sp. NPDC012746]|uniref:hypothetical protein n=1 Tax=Streptomyces sp. NPDC012746 TaxID=3364845 RepID=UPI00369E590F
MPGTLTSIDGLPDSVTITPLTLRDDAYAALCLPCGGGGQFAPIQTYRGEWARPDAYMAARLHAERHARDTEAVLNSELWHRQAESLGWSQAQADTMHWAERGHLHYDGTVYYQMDPDDPRAKGRTVSRARVTALITAGLLECDGRYVTPTQDGHAASRAWVAARPDPARTESAHLRPLLGGEEEARRRRHETAPAAPSHAAPGDGPAEQLTLFATKLRPRQPRPRRPRGTPATPPPGPVLFTVASGHAIPEG